MRSFYLSVKTFNLILFALINHYAYSQTKRFRFSEQKMGSEFTIILYHSDSIKAQIAAINAFKIADSLNHSFSDYSQDSEVSKLSETAGTNLWVKVSTELMEIIEKSKYAWTKSEGAFDITFGRLTKLWRKNKKDRKLPCSDSIKEAMGATGMQFVKINKKSGSIKLEKKGVQIDLGGIGKGFAAQKMLDYLRSQIIPIALCDAAGNMAIQETALTAFSLRLLRDKSQNHCLVARKISPPRQRQQSPGLLCCQAHTQCWLELRESRPQTGRSIPGRR